MKYLPVVGALATVVAAGKDVGTFAVLRFNGEGWLTEGRMDPITDPGTAASHYHNIMGGSNFNLTVNGDDLLSSDCTTAKIKNDKSNYWVPALFFQNPNDGSFTKVDLFYMNVYYFFEATDDAKGIQPFPPGLKILTGNKNQREPPRDVDGKATGAYNIDGGSDYAINNIQITCPQAAGKSSPVYMPNSDGMHAGVADPIATDAGAGFPVEDCDGYASPMRQDIHFPSCYKLGPNGELETHLNDYENNMKFPTIDYTTGKENCGDGWLHTPHMFYEVYWDTPKFTDKWVRNGKDQPFVYSTGDATGYSAHADFISGWDQDTLKWIIDHCNAGTLGMDTCSGIPGGLSTDMDCKIEPMIQEPSFGAKLVSSVLSVLPGGKEVTGWGKNGVFKNIPESPEPEPEPTSSDPIVELPTTPIAPLPEPTKEPTTTATPTPSGGAFFEAAGSVETVWDVVTVTETATQYVEPTGVPERRHHHAHAARHAHHGR